MSRETYKTSSWESKLVAWMLSKRLLVLWVVIALQVLLVGLLGSLLWFTRVRDVVTNDAKVEGVYAVQLEASPDEIRLQVTLGQMVAAEEALAVAGGTSVTASRSGIVWGSAFDASAVSIGQDLPFLAIIEPTSLRFVVETSPSEATPLESGTETKIGLGAEGDAFLEGYVVSLQENKATIQVDAVLDENNTMAYKEAWQRLGTMLINDSSYPLRVETRTRRLLAILISRQ